MREELSKRQAQLEEAHKMLLRHHSVTQSLETKQQVAVHSLKEEQLKRQHKTELLNQEEYMVRALRDLRKKHALQIKQQPKSLKVQSLPVFQLLYYDNLNSININDQSQYCAQQD